MACKLVHRGKIALPGEDLSMRVALLLSVAAVAGASPFAWPASVFTARLDDPKAIYLTAEDFGARGDGQADDGGDPGGDRQIRGQRPRRHRLYPSGRYRLTRTDLCLARRARLRLWSPRALSSCLADNTPGFQKGVGVMVMFTGAGRRSRPGRVPFPPPGSVPPNDAIADANPEHLLFGDEQHRFRDRRGNPAAVAIRFHVAQHAYLSHMDFHIGSGLAALYPGGQRGRGSAFLWRPLRHSHREDLARLAVHADRFSVSTGQREAAIREHEVGLTLIRDTFRNVPTAIDIDPDYSDELWVKDSRFENISGAAVIISNEKSPLTEIGVRERRAEAICRRSPCSAKAERRLPGKGAVYAVQNFNLWPDRSRRRQDGHDRHAL